MNSVRQMVRVLPLILFASMSIFLTNCGDKNADTTNTFSSIYAATFKTACIQCHVPGTSTYVTNGVHLDFTSATTAYTTLTTNTVAGSSSIGTCAGIKIVAASAPTSSYLLGVLFQDYHVNNFAGVSGCTTYATHLTDQNISSTQKSAIIAWITAGAANN